MRLSGKVQVQGTRRKLSAASTRCDMADTPCSRTTGVKVAAQFSITTLGLTLTYFFSFNHLLYDCFYL